MKLTGAGCKYRHAPWKAWDRYYPDPDRHLRLGGMLIAPMIEAHQLTMRPNWKTMILSSPSTEDNITPDLHLRVKTEKRRLEKRANILLGVLLPGMIDEGLNPEGWSRSDLISLLPYCLLSFLSCQMSIEGNVVSYHCVDIRIA